MNRSRNDEKNVVIIILYCWGRGIGVRQLCEGVGLAWNKAKTEIQRRRKVLDYNNVAIS